MEGFSVLFFSSFHLHWLIHCFLFFQAEEGKLLMDRLTALEAKMEQGGFSGDQSSLTGDYSSAFSRYCQLFKDHTRFHNQQDKFQSYTRFALGNFIA